MKNKTIILLALLTLIINGTGCTTQTPEVHLKVESLHEIWHFDAQQRILQPPVSIHEIVTLITAGQTLITLDAISGEEKWRLDTPAQLWSGSLTTTLDAVTLAGQDGRVFALSQKRGIPEWEIGIGGEAQTAPLLDRYILFVSATPFENSAQNAIVYALNAATGAGLWEFESRSASLTRAARGGDWLYVGSSTPGDATLYALSAAEGTQQWANQTLEGKLLFITANAESVVVHNSENQLTALDAATGEIQWQAQPAEPLIWMHIEDDLLLLAAENQLMGWRIDDGSPQWQADLDYPLITPPILDDARLLILMENGELRAYAVSTGELESSFQSKIAAPTGMTINGNRIFIVNQQGQIFAFDSNE
ncbi:MAG: PQQ-like beta-propeller repeat protein [Chloroflexi bacterium]|jgi:eukaryotic-like serine/threonine-protein kinase|nr:PQQ-like beta-propeller repeat protein [Chloroflexota bacterium]